VLGAKFNANFFWSPLTGDIDLLGFDRRIQTDLDGVLDLPAAEQLALPITTQNIEIGHMGATMRESQLEMIFDAAERFVNTCKKEFPPGMVGLFALQGAVTKDLKFYVFDVSPRVPGCPVRRAHVALHEVQVRHGSRAGAARGHGDQESHEGRPAGRRADVSGMSDILDGYDPKNIAIGTLGSHTALNIFKGAKEEGFRTVCVCKEKDAIMYRKFGLADEMIIVADFKELIAQRVQERLRKLNVVLIPHGSFTRT